VALSGILPELVLCCRATAGQYTFFGELFGSNFPYSSHAYTSRTYTRLKAILLTEYQEVVIRKLPTTSCAFRMDGCSSAPIYYLNYLRKPVLSRFHFLLGPTFSYRILSSKANYITYLTNVSQETPGLPPLDQLSDICPSFGSNIPVHYI
jgi:hypothetical protein